ncbi:MAG: hydroxyphenylacetyl-CoA thioesterase PaaI [Candidatus Symbiobacter sp.]|nr:hydroxyphenylacetyl-CoA thioesterase PaaI [Candidatus Symbiobacter sp.]
MDNSAARPHTPPRPVPSDPQELAEACAAALFAHDQSSQAMGMKIEQIGPGTATLAMTIRADMINGHQTCHGGVLFHFGDSCFAFACNSRNQVNVALDCSIDFITPGRLGDHLRGVAREIHASGRTGLYEVVITNQHQHLVAVFRGKSYRIKGEVLDSHRHGTA